MAAKSEQLVLETSPFLKAAISTPRLMGDVLIGLLPVLGASIWFFGVNSLLLLLVSATGAAATERLLSGKGTVGDGSALVTGLIFGLTLPPTLPLWIALLGSVVAMGLGKLVWGGLGQNLFNPALVGRAFLQAAFPGAMTTWAAPRDGFFELSERLTTAPLMQAPVDIVSAATPLAKMKFEAEPTAWWSLFTGNVGGSLGETSAAMILVGGLYLLVRRSFDWRVPASILLTVAAFTGLLHLIAPAKFAAPWFMLLSGGLLFGAIFMATDPVTSPTAPLGLWVFGIGVGALVVLIRVWGGLPEGVMYSILLMNAASPLIERYCQPRPFGRKERSGG